MMKIVELRILRRTAFALADAETIPGGDELPSLQTQWIKLPSECSRMLLRSTASRADLTASSKDQGLQHQADGEIA